MKRKKKKNLIRVESSGLRMAGIEELLGSEKLSPLLGSRVPFGVLGVSMANRQ